MPSAAGLKCPLRVRGARSGTLMSRSRTFTVSSGPLDWGFRFEIAGDDESS